MLCSDKLHFKTFLSTPGYSLTDSIYRPADRVTGTLLLAVVRKFCSIALILLIYLAEFAPMQIADGMNTHFFFSKKVSIDSERQCTT